MALLGNDKNSDPLFACGAARLEPLQSLAAARDDSCLNLKTLRTAGAR
jgi:hypothetical protein